MLEDEIRDITNRVSQKLSADYNEAVHKNQQLIQENGRLEKELKSSKNENDIIKKEFKDKLDDLRLKISKELNAGG